MQGLPNERNPNTSFTGWTLSVQCHRGILDVWPLDMRSELINQLEELRVALKNVMSIWRRWSAWTPLWHPDTPIIKATQVLAALLALYRNSSSTVGLSIVNAVMQWTAWKSGICTQKWCPRPMKNLAKHRRTFSPVPVAVIPSRAAQPFWKNTKFGALTSKMN